MNGYLKQSTAGQVRTIGPFVDSTDFVTLEDGLTIANTDIKIKKNGAASGNKNSGGATADTAGGMYHLTWDATDTATVGELFFSVKVAGALVVFGSYVVLEEAVYDMLFGASAIGYIANQPVDVNTIKTNPVVNAGTVTFPTTATLASTTNITAGTVTTATNVTTVNGLAANVITAASIANAAIDAATFAADVDAEILSYIVDDATRIDASSLNTAAVTSIPAILVDTGTDIPASIAALPTAAENAGAVWDEDATGHQTGGTFGQAIGDPGASTETLFKAIVTDPAGTNIAADIIAIKAETAAILDDTDDIGVAGAGLTAINLPDQTMNITGDITGNLSGSVGSVTGNVGGNVTGTIGGLTAAALKDFFDTDSATTYASAVAGSVVKEIADNAGGGTPPTAAAIADAVWEEAIADHSGTAGSTAEQLAAAGAAGDPWATAIPGAYGAGTAGKILGDNVNAAISSRASQTSVDTIDDFLDTEVAAILAAVDTEVSAILADTNELQTDWVDGGRLDLILDARASQASVDTVDGVVDAILVDTAEIGAAGAGLTALATQASVNTIDGIVDDILLDTGTTLQGELDGIQADTEDIQSRIPAALTAGGKIRASVDEILAVAQSATDLKDFADTGYDPVAHKVAGVVLTDTTTTLTNAPADPAGVTTLLSRLTGVRAGYLDNLSAGAVALEASLQALITTVGVAGAGLTAADDAVLTAIANLATTALTLTAGERNAIADALLARNIAGGSSTGRVVEQALATLRNKTAIAAGVYTCYEADDTTPMFEANVTTAAGNPLSGWSPTT